MTLRVHFGFTAFSHWFHLYLTSVLPRSLHFDVTSMSLPCHSKLILISVRFHLAPLRSIPLKNNFASIVCSLRFHSNFTSITSISLENSQRSLFDFTLVPLRLRLDMASQGKGNIYSRKGKGKGRRWNGKWAADDFAEISPGIPAARTHARTHAQHDTKRFPGWAHTPTSDK